jgi:O-antigen/teichoic acid export membrane protein
MIHWAALGIFFKAASWPIAYLFVAKGHTKLYFYSEMAASLYMLVFNIMGYLWGGLEGLGISFLAGYVIYLVQVFNLAKIKYDFNFERSFQKIFLIQFIVGLLCFFSSKFLDIKYLYFAGSALIIFSSIYSFTELNKRIGLRALITDQFKRKNRE